MADDSFTPEVISGVVAFFVILSWVWNMIQVGGWIKKKLRPPEDKQHFDGRASLMLEEVYFGMRSLSRRSRNHKRRRFDDMV